MRRQLLGLGLTMPWLSGCTTTGILAALTRFGGAIETGVAYGAHPRQKLDIYRPRVGGKSSAGAAAASGARSAAGGVTVLFFYGGSWNRGERADYAFVGKALAARGITTLIADYRLYPEVRYPDFLIDGAMAAAWTFREVARLGGDPQRVFVMGHSAGAYNAAMLALDARWLGQQNGSPNGWAGWIGMAGPYEFLPITIVDAQPVFFHPNYPTHTQPIDHVTAQAPRTLLLSARSDNMVNPVRNSAALAQRLASAGVAVQHLSFERVDHQTLLGALASPLTWLAPVAESIVSFVQSGQQR